MSVPYVAAVAYIIKIRYCCSYIMFMILLHFLLWILIFFCEKTDLLQFWHHGSEKKYHHISILHNDDCFSNILKIRTELWWLFRKIINFFLQWNNSKIFSYISQNLLQIIDQILCFSLVHNYVDLIFRPKLFYTLGCDLSAMYVYVKYALNLWVCTHEHAVFVAKTQHINFKETIVRKSNRKMFGPEMKNVYSVSSVEAIKCMEEKLNEWRKNNHQQHQQQCLIK